MMHHEDQPLACPATRGEKHQPPEDKGFALELCIPAADISRGRERRSMLSESGMPRLS